MRVGDGGGRCGSGLAALTEFSLSAASRWFSFGIIPRTMRTDKSPARLQLILTVTWQRKDSIRTRRSANAHRVYATSMMPTSADSRPGLDDGHGRRPGAFARPRVHRPRRERGCAKQQMPRTFDGRTALGISRCCGTSPKRPARTRAQHECIRCEHDGGGGARSSQ